MDQSTEARLRELEAMTTFLHANQIALQTTLIAALTTINRDPATRAEFTKTLKAAVEGSYDHAIGTTWTDEFIAITRQGIAAFAGKEIAAEVGLL